MPLALQFGEVVLLLLAVMIAVSIITWLVRRRRQDVWKELANRRGLRFADRKEGPRITGQLQGRSVTVNVDEESSDRDVGGVEVVLISVGVNGFPPNVTAEGVPGLIGDLVGLSEDRINFEPEEFHRDVLIKGDETEARNYWSNHRKEVFLKLVRTAQCDQVTIRDGVLVAELREIVSDRIRLEQLLDELMNAAKILDKSSGQ